MIPLPIVPRLWIFAGVAVLAALVIANTYRLSAAVDRARADLAQCGAERDRLQDAIDEQNKAVEAMRKAAQDAQQRAAKALADVQAMEHARAHVSERLEAFRRRSGETECDASRRLIQEYRK